ncbi:MAG: prepilin-type N-terminal cleavage/methylation domain-containing protein [Candidatus Omnitrophota bacterium]
MSATRASKGFTLIELLIVVAIIGILAAIAVPNFLNAQTKAKVTRAHSDLKALGTAIEMYGIDRNTYPGGEGFWGGTKWWTKHTYRFHVLTTPVAYMSSVPIDPFQTSNPQRLNASLGTIWDGGYVYDEEKRPGGGAETMKLYGPSFKYAARSPGPALNWASEISHGNRIVMYEGSNGLVSNGILAVLGPGGTVY